MRIRVIADRQRWDKIWAAQ